MPQRKRAFILSPLAILLGGAFLSILAMVGFTRWLHGKSDAEMLGNTPNGDSACATHFGLTGPGLGDDRHTKLTLVVAWQAGCLGDDYRKFLEDLQARHRGELQIVGAGLAIPPSHERRLLGKDPEPPAGPFPPKGCEPGFEVLPISQGYVSDFLSSPATYLYDDEGSLIAVWRGGMSPMQRERLATWLDGRTWDR
jgi:hypothetical protein